jgi:hypothetical protein
MTIDTPSYIYLVLSCGNSSEFNPRSLCQCCVVISRRVHRTASFFLLALTQISGTEFTVIPARQYQCFAVLTAGALPIQSGCVNLSADKRRG